MPQFRSYPEVTTVNSTDAFILDRVGTGTVWIPGSALLPAVAPNSMFSVANYAALRALTDANAGVVYVRGAVNIDDGGQGVFLYQSADTTSTDNGGTILVPTATLTGRWHRDYVGAAVNIQWFGAVCDGTTDDIAAWNLAMALYSVNGNATATGTIVVPGVSAVSAPIVYAGSSSYNLTIMGTSGGSQAVNGSCIKWIGTFGTSMLIATGSFSFNLRDVNFDPGSGVGISNCVHITASNTYSQTLSGNIAAGSNVTVTVGSTTGLSVGTALPTGAGTAAFEVLYVKSIGGATTFTADVRNAHLAGATVGAGQGCDSPRISGCSMGVPVGATSAGVLFGNLIATTPQVSNGYVDGCTFRGRGSAGQAFAGVRIVEGGNVKSFDISRSVFYSFSKPVSIEGDADNVGVRYCQFENTTTTDISGTGVTFLNVIGCEAESATGHRFLTTTTGVTYAQAVNISGSSFEAAAPGDDIIILTGAALTITGNQFKNTRTGATLPLISVGNSMFRTPSSANAGSIVSMNNFFLNGGPNAQVFYDSGNPYNIIGWAEHLQVARVTSIGDYGTNGGMPTINGQADCRQYGVVGDGTTDDAAALNAAILANYGGTLCLNVNQMLIGSPMTVNKPIQIVGLGGGRNNSLNYGTRIFTTTNGINLFNNIIASGGGNDDFGGSISGILFDGNSHAAIGMDLEGATNVKWLFENVNVINCTDRGTKVLGNHSYRFLNCQWALNGSSAQTNAGVEVAGANAVNFIGCNAEANLGHGVIFSGGYENSWYGGAIEGNKFDGVLLKSTAQHVTLSEIDFEQNGTAGGTFTASLTGTTLTVTAVSAGVILGVGCRITGAGVANGPFTTDSGPTFITALGSGTGGAGTYTVSPAPVSPVSSETMTAGYYDVDISTNTQSGVVVQNCKFTGTHTLDYVRNNGDQTVLRNLRGDTLNKILWTVTAASGLFEGDVTLQIDPASYMASNMQVINTRPVGFAMTTPAFPASTVLWQNLNNGWVNVYITAAGTATAFSIVDPNGTARAITAALTPGLCFPTPPGGGLKFTYTVAPTWQLMSV